MKNEKVVNKEKKAIDNQQTNKIFYDGKIITQKEFIELTKKITNTNRARNDLIDQINASIRVLVDKKFGVDSKIQITADDLLGTGKNKFYKVEDH